MDQSSPARSGVRDSDGARAAPAPRAPWRERRRRRILDAAAALFARLSFRKVNMDDVAAAATVGKATLYRYFPSKRDLYLAILDMALEDVARQLDAVLAGPGSAASQIEHMVALLVPALAGHLRDLRASDEGLALLADSKRRLLRARRQDITTRIERVLARGVGSGELRPIEPEFCAEILVGMIWAGSVAIAEPTGVAADRISSLLLYGALASPDQHPAPPPVNHQRRHASP